MKPRAPSTDRAVVDASGNGFDWIETPGTPAGGYWEVREGTCPYPIRDDYSAKACKAAGDCGCNEKDKP